jgi:hypothetical protein
MFIGRFISSHILPNMSLPNATKDTTEHPPKNAVAAPVNKQEKAADVDRKVLSFMHLPLTLLLTHLLSVSSDSMVSFRLSVKGVILPTARLTLP